MADDSRLILHATCVSVQGKGLLAIGPSGSGKSSLALALMALGARLVADDRTILELRDGTLWATCPPALRGMIEARGLGLLNASPEDGVQVTLVVDLSAIETERLPPQRNVSYLGRTVALVQAQQTPHFPAALLHYLKAGRRE